MQLSKEAIEEYKEIHKKKSGKDISDEEAYEQASNLIGLFDILLRVDMRNDPKKYIKKGKQRE